MEKANQMERTCQFQSDYVNSETIN